MTLGQEVKVAKSHMEEVIVPETDDDIEALKEIAIKKNRERFAINKSYSIEVNTI